MTAAKAADEDEPVLLQCQRSEAPRLSRAFWVLKTSIEVPGRTHMESIISLRRNTRLDFIHKNNKLSDLPPPSLFLSTLRASHIKLRHRRAVHSDTDLSLLCAVILILSVMRLIPGKRGRFSRVRATFNGWQTPSNAPAEERAEFPRLRD